MIADPPRQPLEDQVARLLRGGTVVASLLIAAGLLLAALNDDTRLIAAGIAVFILLPMVRLGLMAIGFARERDARYTVVALVVLFIVLIGITLGLADVL